MNYEKMLKVLGVKESEVKFFYMNTKYIRPFEVKIISSTALGNCEIISIDIYKNCKKQTGSGTLVDMYGLWIKTPKRFKKVRELLMEIDAVE